MAITVTQVQLRNALIDLGLYSQWDSYMTNMSTDKGRVYWQYSPTISSDATYLTEDTTGSTEVQRYAVFLLAETL